MSALVMSLLLAAFATLAVLCALPGLARRLHRGAPRPSSVPLVLALLRGLALPATAGCARLLDERRRVRLAAALESLELAPYFTPAGWLATRATGAATAGIAAGALAATAGAGAWLPALLAAGTGWFAPERWLRQRRARLQLDVLRELPAYLDLLTVCVEAGATLTAGVRLIIAQAPPGPVRSYFDRVLREVRGGRPRAAAFLHVADLFAVESLSSLAGALAQAEHSGMSLGQVLRAQSAQRTSERFARAEQLAMQAPVKMLGPLILCIFPCTFIVLAVPIAVRLKEVLVP